MFSVVSIVPAGKKSDEHTAPLSPTGQMPVTHYGLHGWQAQAPVAQAGESIRAVADTYHRREVLKEQIPEAEKSGKDSFLRAAADLGLRQVDVTTRDTKPSEIKEGRK